MRTANDLFMLARSSLYMAIDPRQGWDFRLAHQLTPKVMRWSESLWILDLTPCLSYWRQDGHDVHFWSEVVCHLGLGAQVRMAMAVSPWQAMLLLRQMEYRGLSGVLSVLSDAQEGSGGQAARKSYPLRATQIFSDIGWEIWLALAQEAAPHFSKIGLQGFSQQKYAAQLRFLQRHVEQLGLPHIGQFRQLTAMSFRRRFGTVLQLLWQWTWDQTLADQSGFPWCDAPWVEQPVVTRHLDQPLAEWEHIEPLLCEDFNRLCDQRCFDQQEKVVRLEWRLVLPNLETLSIFLPFRHPHSLHQSRPHQKTALLQASYAFSQHRSASCSSQLLSDGGDESLVIVGWTVMLTEKITLPPQMLELFDDFGPQDEARLRDLENRVAVPLQACQVKPSWLPDNSSACQMTLDKAAEPCRQAQLWVESAINRPLYLFEKPQALASNPKGHVWKFYERLTTAWWRSNDNDDQGALWSDCYRDYYRMTDDQKRHWWVYRDAATTWCVHGIFA